MASAFNPHNPTSSFNETPPIDLTFYNILNVSPTATAAEIKKAYYALSLKYHPDRTQGLNESIRAEFAEHFKEISQAYTILSDPERRALYNKYGKDERVTACDISMHPLDPDELFRSLFGGEQFKEIIGDFESSRTLKRAFGDFSGSDDYQTNAMSEQEKFLRRQQEIEEQRRAHLQRVDDLARNLTVKLDYFVRVCNVRDVDSIPDHVLERFLDEIRMETMNLIQAPYGEKLLRSIGYIYSLKAQLWLSKMDSKNGSFKDRVKNRAQYFRSSVQARAHLVKELAKAVQKSAQLAKSMSELDEANQNENFDGKTSQTVLTKSPKSRRKSSSKQSFPLTSEQKRLLEDDIASKSTKLLWQAVKLDIENTQNEVCDRVLNDQDVSHHILRLRCFTLDKIGEIWQNMTILNLND